MAFGLRPRTPLEADLGMGVLAESMGTKLFGCVVLLGVSCWFTCSERAVVPLIVSESADSDSPPSAPLPAGELSLAECSGEELKLLSELIL